MNPFLIVIGALAAIGLIIGGVLTVQAGAGELPLELAQLAGTLLTVGIVAGVGALVLAGSEWRARQQR